MPEEIVKETLYDKLKDRLLDFIEKKSPKMLPPEKDLISHYGVSRNTVRRAIQDLCNDGILKTVQGVGTLVLNPADKMGKAMILVIRGKKLMPYQRDVIDELLFELSDYRLNSLLMVFDPEKPDMERLDFLLSKSDGVIIDQVAVYSREICDRIAASKKRCVCIRWHHPTTQGFPYVFSSLEEGFQKIAGHLLSLGHKRIAYVGRLDEQERLAGIKSAGVSLSPELIINSRGLRPNAYEAASALLALRGKFSAIIAMNDEAALGIMERLLIAGVKIPEEVSITGFDNIHESADFPVPLTTCGASLPLMADKTISMVLQMDARKNSSDTVPPELVVRASTAKASS